VLKRLVELGYLDQISEEIYELTEEGFARAIKRSPSFR
jgi:Mn-dependent DtxR family transcriptional regulator